MSGIAEHLETVSEILAAAESVGAHVLCVTLAEEDRLLVDLREGDPAAVLLPLDSAATETGTVGLSSMWSGRWRGLRVSVVGPVRVAAMG